MERAMERHARETEIADASEKRRRNMVTCASLSLSLSISLLVARVFVAVIVAVIVAAAASALDCISISSRSSRRRQVLRSAGEGAAVPLPTAVVSVADVLLSSSAACVHLSHQVRQVKGGGSQGGSRGQVDGADSRRRQQQVQLRRQGGQSGQQVSAAAGRCRWSSSRRLGETRDLTRRRRGSQGVREGDGDQDEGSVQEIMSQEDEVDDPLLLLPLLLRQDRCTSRAGDRRLRDGRRSGHGDRGRREAVAEVLPRAHRLVTGTGR